MLGHIICAYEDETSLPSRVGYAVSNDGGDTWTTGTLSDTGIAADAPAVTAPYNTGGFMAVYRCRTPTCELLFRAGQYNGTWYSPHSVADCEPYWSRPGVREVVSNVFGVVYLSDTSPVVRGAYFDRSDWSSGLAEQRLPQTSNRASLATVVRGVLFLPMAENGYSPQEEQSPFSELLDISGRNVMDLRPGANDVRALAPGVYFVRAVSRKLSAVSCSKVVITR